MYHIKNIYKIGKPKNPIKSNAGSLYLNSKTNPLYSDY
jgi:hypothetical protein